MDSLQSSINELSNYMLERLNYQDFSLCSFKVVYSDIETKVFNLFMIVTQKHQILSD